MLEDTVIAEITKNSREVIRVTLGAFKNQQIAGARVWFKADDGSWRPGKSGIAFKIELLPAVVDAFTEAAAAARARGALE
jgi:hypothetical protein